MMVKQTPPQLVPAAWPAVYAAACLLAGCAAPAAPDPALPAPEYTRYTTAPDPPPPSIIVDPEPAPTGAQVPPIPLRADDAIAEAARAELAELAAGSGPARIEVAVERGVALLTGTVPTLLHARVAADRVSTVRGIRALVNRLNVAAATVNDEELGARVRASLSEDPALDDLSLSVSAREGTVQLTGRVLSYTEKELASRVTESVRGVREVVNELELVPKSRSDRELESDILARIAYDAYLGDDPIRADVNSGLVSLSGVVGTFMEKRRAQTQAWVSGVRAVNVDALVVAPARRDPEQRLTRPMPTDEQVAGAVRNALRLDPRVPEGSVVASVEAGIVRLHGTVTSLVSKRAAEEDAANTLGAWRVESFITVSPQAPSGDAALVQRITERLAEHPEIDLEKLTIEANAGRVALRGASDDMFETLTILRIVERTPGVIAVETELGRPPVVPVRSDAALERVIERALWWDPRVDGSRLELEVRGGVASISGTVPNRAVHEAVLENIRQARPLAIEDHLERGER